MSCSKPQGNGRIVILQRSRHTPLSDSEGRERNGVPGPWGAGQGEEDRKHPGREKGLGWASGGLGAAPGSLWLWHLHSSERLYSALRTRLSPCQLGPLWAVIPAAACAPWYARPLVRAFRDPASQVGQTWPVSAELGRLTPVCDSDQTGSLHRQTGLSREHQPEEECNLRRLAD